MKLYLFWKFEALPIYLIVSGALLAACSTPSAPYETPVAVAGGGSFQLSGNGAPPQYKIRQGESVKEYVYNPYVDPNNPDTRYSEGVIHRVEQSARWNLTPGAHETPKTASSGVAVASREKINEGPMEAVADDQAVSVSAVPAHLEQELARERQYRQAMAEQLQAQTEITKDFAKTLTEARQVVEENRQIRAELREMKETEARRIAAAKAKADAEAAKQAQPFYKRWFSKEDQAKTNK